MILPTPIISKNIRSIKARTSQEQVIHMALAESRTKNPLRELSDDHDDDDYLYCYDQSETEDLILGPHGKIKISNEDKYKVKINYCYDQSETDTVFP